MRRTLVLACVTLAFGSAALAQQGRFPVTAPPPIANITRGGVIQGYVFWPANAAQYNHAAPCSPLKVRVVPRSEGGTFQGEDEDLTHIGVIGGYEVCAYRIQGVPEGQDMHMLFLPNPPGFTPSLTFDMAAVDRQFPKFYVNIPGGACTKTASPTPSFSELTTWGWWPCGDNAYDVNFGVYPPNIPTTRVSGPIRVAPGVPLQSGPPNGMLLNPGPQHTLLGGNVRPGAQNTLGSQGMMTTPNGGSKMPTTYRPSDVTLRRGEISESGLANWEKGNSGTPAAQQNGVTKAT